MGVKIKTRTIMTHGQCFLTVISFLALFECIISLKMLELRVPAHVVLGTRAHLYCRWALGPADVLYSVKWYKDGKEFFRHVPRDHEPRRKFPLPGVDVEQSDSSGSDIVLSGAVSETAGRYRCEVSGERPLFPTVSEHADMTVVVLPDHGPVITGCRSRYRLGDHVQVNCTSRPSIPSVQLSWYINGEPLPTSKSYDDTINGDGRTKKTFQLNFATKENHFKNSTIKIKCLATIGTLYWQSDEVSALLDKDRTDIDSTPHHMITRADRIQTTNNKAPAENVSSMIFVCLVVVILFVLN